MESKAISKFIHVWPQWLAALEVFVHGVVTGMALGWLPPFLGLLRSPNSPYEATIHEISWIASLISFAKPIGVVSGSLAQSYLGSKRAMNICVFFLLTGYMFLIFANKIEIIYLTLICNGLNLGAGAAVYPVYISEISAAHIRGRLMSLVSQGQVTGLLLGNLMGIYFTPHAYAITCMTTTIFFFITFIFLPQTAYHMIRCNKMEEAAKSIRWYNRGGDTEKDFMDISEFLKSNPKLSFFLMLKTLFKSPVNRQTLLKLCLFALLLQMTGLPTIERFMVIIFTDARVTTLKPTTGVTILTLVNILASWISLYVMDKFKRKTIYFTSCTGATIALIGIASTFILLDYGNTDPNVQWIIIISAIVCQVTYTIGVPIFMTLLGEMFAPNVKSISIGIVLIVYGIMSFLANKSFIFLVELLTYKYVFYMLAGFAIINGIYVIFFIPETKGKTLQEIQKMLNGIKNSECYENPAVIKLTI